MEVLLAVLLPISIWVFKFLDIPFWVAGVFLVPLIFLKKNPYWGKLLSLGSLVLGVASLLLRNAEFVYWYPVLVNLILFAVFLPQIFVPRCFVAVLQGVFVHQQGVFVLVLHPGR